MHAQRLENFAPSPIPSNTDPYDLFGSSVSLWGDTLAVGARLEDSSATGPGGDQANDSALKSGAVYVFH